jgi:1,4-alpha-glucan branching enzyme
VASASDARATRRVARDAGIHAFAIRALAIGEVEIRVRAPGASMVELNGDLTQWEPLALTQTGDGWWIARIPALSGTTEMVLRADRGAWVVPPGVESVSDEFGGRAGRVHIP